MDNSRMFWSKGALFYDLHSGPMGNPNMRHVEGYRWDSMDNLSSSCVNLKSAEKEDKCNSEKSNLN